MPKLKNKTFDEVQTHLDKLNNDREVKTGNSKYPYPKEGMIDMHMAWQRFINAMKSKDIKNRSAAAATKLAATAIKFASDFGSEK